MQSNCETLQLPFDVLIQRHRDIRTRNDLIVETTRRVRSAESEEKPVEQEKVGTEAPKTPETEVKVEQPEEQKRSGDEQPSMAAKEKVEETDEKPASVDDEEEKVSEPEAETDETKTSAPSKRYALFDVRKRDTDAGLVGAAAPSSAASASANSVTDSTADQKSATADQKSAAAQSSSGQATAAHATAGQATNATGDANVGAIGPLLLPSIAPWIGAAHLKAINDHVAKTAALIQAQVFKNAVGAKFLAAPVTVGAPIHAALVAAKVALDNHALLFNNHVELAKARLAALAVPKLLI